MASTLASRRRESTLPTTPRSTGTTSFRPHAEQVANRITANEDNDVDTNDEDEDEDGHFNEEE